MSDRDNRTEKPTAKQVTRAHERGQVVHSQDVGHAVSLLVFLVWASLAGGSFMQGATELVRGGLRATLHHDDHGLLQADILRALVAGLRMIGPLMLGLMVFGVAGTLLQGGIHPRKGLIPFELERLNPITGMKRLVSTEKLIAAVKAVVRTALYAAVAIAVVMPEWAAISALCRLTPAAILEEAFRIAARVLSRALLVGIVFAVVDYGVTRYRFYRGLYMTKQEVRDEAKEQENPEIKGRIRGRQREVARRRMMAFVRTADVVVTNPTHVAVALKYDRAAGHAPLVVAKGKGYVALRIREVATGAGVPIVEDPPLARTLEKLCPLGTPIPETLYRAVAEVFAHILRARRGPRPAYRIHPEVEAAADEVTP